MCTSLSVIKVLLSSPFNQVYLDRQLLLHKSHLQGRPINLTKKGGFNLTYILPQGWAIAHLNIHPIKGRDIPFQHTSHQKKGYSILAYIPSKEGIFHFSLHPIKRRDIPFYHTSHQWAIPLTYHTPKEIMGCKVLKVIC